MKIYFNRKPVIGPWGGGNKTLSSITEKLSKIGHDVVFDLEKDLDALQIV